jgi:hypothetical protein
MERFGLFTPFTKREWVAMTGSRRLAVHIFLMVAIGVVLALVAPFGSDNMPAGLRFAAWVGFTITGYFIFRPVGAVGAWLAAETHVPGWLAALLTGLVAALPLAALIAFALGGFRVTEEWFSERFLLLYLQVAGLGLVIQVLMRLIFRAPARADEAQPAAAEPALNSPSAAPAAPFLDRLPPHLGRDLLCLEMQDHYVAAHTRAGSTLLLMRFRDAVAELGAAGMQVHRSWWVAKDAVDGLEEEGRSARLKLRGGRIVPVSRAHLPAVRAALSPLSASAARL